MFRNDRNNSSDPSLALTTIFIIITYLHILILVPLAMPDPKDLRLFLGGSSVSAGGDMTSVLFVLTSDSSAGNGSISTTYRTNLFYS